MLSILMPRIHFLLSCQANLGSLKNCRRVLHYSGVIQITTSDHSYYVEFADSNLLKSVLSPHHDALGFHSVIWSPLPPKRSNAR